MLITKSNIMVLFVKCDRIGGRNAITAQSQKKLTGKYCTLRGLGVGDDQPKRSNHPPLCGDDDDALGPNSIGP